MGKDETVQERYKRWWEGKYCRLANRGIEKFKYVQTVEFFGPPSGVYGSVKLHYLDGTSEYVIPLDQHAFKPRKMDVEVEIVSILVLMDVPLQPYKPAATATIG